MEKLLRRTLLCLFVLTAIGGFYGCGYTIHGHAALPFTEIWVGAIENRTHEPGLQDMLHRALVEELVKQGISVRPSAPRKLTGVIRTFELPSLSEKDGITREYRVLIDADFTATDEKGSAEYVKHMGSPFIVVVTGSEDMARLLANKTLAEERALKDMAARLVGALIFK
ncbi:MAG: hypothetical protein EPN25_10635 [Nitrospirae bacterium]|nr:MAG: hypothetical protein EPN25_10635 [Nitrospirota bacterium]